MRAMQKSWLMMFTCLMLGMVACSDEPTDTPTPTPAKDMAVEDQGVDMTVEDQGEDMAQADMAEPDMTEPDMAEPDMAMDPMISGSWTLKKYDGTTATDTVAELTLMNVMGSTEVTGDYTQSAEMGSVSGTYSAGTLALEWTVSGASHQFVNGKAEGEQIVGSYNDPALGGIPQGAVLVRP